METNNFKLSPKYLPSDIMSSRAADTVSITALTESVTGSASSLKQSRAQLSQYEGKPM